MRFHFKKLQSRTDLKEPATGRYEAIEIGCRCEEILENLDEVSVRMWIAYHDVDGAEIRGDDRKAVARLQRGSEKLEKLAGGFPGAVRDI